MTSTAPVIERHALQQLQDQWDTEGAHLKVVRYRVPPRGTNPPSRLREGQGEGLLRRTLGSLALTVLALTLLAGLLLVTP